MNVLSETTPSSLTDSSFPSQNGGSNVTTVSTPAVNVQKARMNAKDQIAGYIFMCNSNTKPDCFIYRVFGLPASRLAVAEQIKPNTKLFLYDFEVKLLYGMYVADSSGKMAIEPYAFEGRFPAQVKFSILRDCLPLSEAVFKEAIRENYSGGSKFKQTLTEEQVNDLVSRFRPINVSLPLRSPPLLHDPVEIRHPADRGSTFQNTNFSSHGQYSSGSDHANMQLHPSSSHPTHNHVAVARSHMPVVAQPLHSHPSFSQHSQVLVSETYHPDHPGLYEQNTHTRYGAALQITSADSYYAAPNPIPESHISSQQTRSSMTAAHWVALASEARTPGAHHASTATPTIPSSSDYQQPPYNYNNHHEQTQAGVDGTYTYYNSHASTATSTIPSSSDYQQPPYNYNNHHEQTQVGVDGTYMYYNSASTQAAVPPSEYQYQGHQACHQMHSVATVQVAGTSNGVSHVSETYVTYGAATVPHDYVHQMPGAEVSADPRTGYGHTQYYGPNPTY